MEQSWEYLQKGRDCLLRALNFETNEDKRRAKQVEMMSGPLGRRLHVMIEQAQPLVGMISDDERKRRRKIFGRLYAGCEEDNKAPAKVEVDFDSQMKKSENKPAVEARSSKGHVKKDAQESSLDSYEGESMMGKKEGVVTPSMSTEDSDTILEPAPSVGLRILDNILLLPAPETGLKSDDLLLPPAPEADPAQDDLLPPPAPSSDPNSADNLPPPAPVTKAGTKRSKNPPEGKNMSLEDRLAQLESSLPPSARSEKERMAEIKKGLGRLGLSIPDSQNASIAKVFKNHMTEEEQVQQIMEMAADEAKLEGHIVDNGELQSTIDKGDENAKQDLHLEEDNNLKDILLKSGMAAEEISKGGTLEEVLGDAGMQLLKEIKAKDSNVCDFKDRSVALTLISAAQELLFEAASHLEDDEDGDSGVEDEKENEEDSDILTLSEEVRNRKSAGLGESIYKGRASLSQAQRYIDRALQSLPT